MPLRVPDFASYIRSQDLPEFRPPAQMSACLGAPIRHRGENVGNIYLAKSEPGQKFTREDEDTLVMFASQAALVIGNVRRYRDERRARADLETLIDTSPVGVVVFDARTGVPVSFNRESRRIIGSLPDAGIPREATPRRAHLPACRMGAALSLAEFPLAQALSTGGDRPRRGDRHADPRRPVGDHAGQCHAHPFGERRGRVGPWSRYRT